MPDSHPKISVVTAVYNGAATIERLLDSVQVQSWPYRELIVQDGGSTDGTVGILEQPGKGITRWESVPDHGVYDAWNRALDHVTGDWVLFLGADDYLWDAGALERAAPLLLQRGRSCPVLYGTTLVVDAAGGVLRSLGDPWPIARTGLTWDMPIPNPSTFYRHDLFERYGRFDPSYRCAGDYEFALRVLMTNSACFLEEVTVTGMRSGGLSDDLRRKAALVYEVLHAQRRHGLRRLPPGLSLRLLRVRIHALLVRLLGEESALRLVNGYRALRGRPPLSL
jgi:glycosyltransferase involved in cell wall biosynthesis